MKMFIGKNPATEFQLLADDGTDLTSAFYIDEIHIIARPRQFTEMRIVAKEASQFREIVREGARVKVLVPPERIRIEESKMIPVCDGVTDYGFDIRSGEPG